MLKQIACRAWGVSILGDIQTLTGHGQAQCALSDPVLQEYTSADVPSNLNNSMSLRMIH